MNRVVTAIESGRCALGVSSALLVVPEVQLALKERPALPAMALAGNASAPAVRIDDNALARVTQAPGGVLVLVDPQPADMPGVQQIAQILSKAPNKPTVLVAAHQYNALAFMSAFRGLAVGHIKVRGKDFFKPLPIPKNDTPPPEAPKAKGGTSDAPRFAFVGRDEELAALKGMLGQGGPIVVSGPAGIGKTELAEHALLGSGIERLPDIVLGWGTGFDALIARIAEIARQGGSEKLYEAVKAKAAPKAVVAAAIEALQGAAGNEGKVLIVHDLHVALGRDDDFFRKSRLEMLLEALLTNTYPLRIVFLSRSQPVFHRDHAAGPLRRLPIVGIKGRFLHEIFEACKAPEFPREKFGPLSDRIFGHPYAAKLYAIEIRDRENGVALLDDEKFMAMESVSDTGPLRKRIDAKVEALSEGERRALAFVAHFRLPVTASVLSEFKLNRKERLELQAKGLVETIGTENDKQYGVHSLVRSSLSIRETSDFELLGFITEHYKRQSDNATNPLTKLALAQEANRNAIGARALRLRTKLELPDDDAMLEAVTGMIRSKKPNFEFAATCLREILANNPANSDAHLLKLELMQRTDTDREQIEAAIVEAAEKAPVPEVFHQSVTWYLVRRARNKAVSILEVGLTALPEQSRLHTRISALLVRVGRRKDAIEHLRKAMEIDPLLPDAYGLLGQTKRDEGLSALTDAEALLREAVRLAPEDPTQIARLVDLLLAKARLPASLPPALLAPVEGEEGAAPAVLPVLSDADRQKLRDEARDHLDRVVRTEKRAADAYVLMATLVREGGGDLERASWLLKKARKLTEKGSERVSRILLEEAFVELGRGDLDAAEKHARDLAERDPSNPQVFQLLSKVLEARGLTIPAHAELMRARERVSRGSIDRLVVEADLLRLQAAIEAQIDTAVAAGELQPAHGAGIPEIAPDAAQGHQRVIRRKKHDEPHDGEAPAEDAAMHPDEVADEGSQGFGAPAGDDGTAADS